MAIFKIRRIMLAVGSYDKQGGTNTFVRGLSKELSDKGDYVLVASQKLKKENFKNRTISNNLEVKYFPAFPRKRYFIPFYILRFIGMSYYIAKWCSQKKIDIILTGETEALPFMISKLMGVKVVIRGGNPFPEVTKLEFEKNKGKSNILNFLIDLYEKIILGLSDGIVILSNWEKSILDRYSKKKKEMIRYAVNTKKFKGPLRKNRNLIYVGRISPSKNIESLIRIFDKVKQKNKNLKLTLVGQLEEYNNIDSLLNKSKYKKDIIYLGEKNADEIPQILCKNGIFIHAAFDLGNAPLEAAATRMPVVVMGKKFDEKYVINSKDEKEFVKNILLLVNSKKEYFNNSNFNRSFVMENHSWGKICESYQRIFRKTIGN